MPPKLPPIALVVALVTSGSSGQLNAQDFTWEQRSDMPAGRWGASTFVIDGTAYVVAGRIGSQDRTEMWAYDITTDSWSAKAPIPIARRLAATFVIEGKGYVSCGLYSSSSKLDDLWEYDPLTNAWTQRADFPGTARYGTYHFGLNGLGYVGAGNIGSVDGPFLADAFKYDPTSDSWSAAAPLPDLARHGTASFVMGGRAYVFGGKGSDLSFSPDLWSFDATLDSWTMLAPFPGSPRSSPLAFVYENDAVIGCGRNDAINFYDVWRYDPATDQWSTVPQYPGESSLAGTSFSIAGRAFGGLGWVLTTNESSPDLWELVKPTGSGVEDATIGEGRICMYPNVVESSALLHFTSIGNARVLLTIIDAHGALMKSFQFVGSHDLPVTGMTAGHYVVRWRTMGKEGHIPLVVAGD